MRRYAYEGLLRLPYKIAAGSVTAFGAIGTVWPDKLRDMIGAGFSIERIAQLALAVGAIYFLLLWLLKPSETPSDAGHKGPSQSTSGRASHNFGSVAGDVYINPPPPAVQERNSSSSTSPDMIAQANAS